MNGDWKKFAWFIGLFFVYFVIGVYYYLDKTAWHAHSSITHTLLQSVATIIAFFVGSAALYHFYSEVNGKYMLLFIGVGFMGTFIIDAYHTLVTTAWFIHEFPQVPSSVIEWSWLSTRMFLAALMVISAIEAIRTRGSEIVKTKPVYITVGILTVLILLVFMFIKVPLPMYPDHIIARPLELIPGVLFLIALVMYFVNGGWKTDVLEFWIILFLITSVATQFFFIDLSKHPHDALYIGAHVMKMISYGMVYMGVTSKG